MHYIIALSAPHEPKKGRVISNGSGINLRYKRSHASRLCLFVAFSVGEVGKEEKFGGDLPRLDGPRYQEGYLPIVEWNYQVGASTYSQQAFACVESPLKETATIMAQFMLRDGPPGRVVATSRGQPDRRARWASDPPGGRRESPFWLDEHWTWDETQKRLTADLVPGSQACLAVFTMPWKCPRPSADRDKYREQQTKCAATWSKLIKQSASSRSRGACEQCLARAVDRQLHGPVRRPAVVQRLRLLRAIARDRLRRSGARSIGVRVPA